MTRVPDASVMVAALVDSGTSGVASRFALAGEDLIAPALLDTEVAHALRGRVAGGKLDHDVARRALADLAALQIERFDAVPLLTRMWELRTNLTAYDATYVALAEAFDATLVTADLRLVRASRPRCRFDHVTVH
jgi:predicted nucleic acid-binding protein